MSRFTVIIPTYNNASSLPRTINSVLSQRVTDWQLIIVDDGSKDNTEEIVSSFLKDKRIQYIKKSNEGVAAARNTGFANSNGEYIIFLDSDDEILPNHLSDFTSILEDKKSVGFISCGMKLNHKVILPRVQKGISRYKYSVYAGSFCIKRIVFERIGTYDEKLKQGENWEMVARALHYCKKNSLGIHYMDKCNLLYHHFKTEEKVFQRDFHRAEAHEYLAEKYKDSGVLQFKRCDFLLTAAVNYTRTNKIKKARQLFLDNFRCKPTFSGLLRLLIFEVPFLRKRKWSRNYKG